jgi:hypothetical protein
MGGRLTEQMDMTSLRQALAEVFAVAKAEK